MSAPAVAPAGRLRLRQPMSRRRGRGGAPWQSIQRGPAGGCGAPSRGVRRRAAGAGPRDPRGGSAGGERRGADCSAGGRQALSAEEPCAVRHCALCPEPGTAGRTGPRRGARAAGELEPRGRCPRAQSLACAAERCPLSGGGTWRAREPGAGSRPAARRKDRSVGRASLARTRGVCSEHQRVGPYGRGVRGPLRALPRSPGTGSPLSPESPRRELAPVAMPRRRA